jgi:hypothetical protein
MGLASLDVHYEADAAGIMFRPRIVQALFGRQAGLYLLVHVVLIHHTILNVLRNVNILTSFVLLLETGEFRPSA